MNRSKSILSILLILVITGGVTYFIFTTEPEAQQESATKKSAMLVEVIKGEYGDFRPTILATGTVQPSRDISLSVRVSGEIVAMANGFVPGNNVKRGEALVRIDPADFKNIVSLRKAELAIAEAQIQLEMGMQEAAKTDYKLAQGESSSVNKALLIREPQLAIAKANLNTAKTRLQLAELNLSRTTITAPFDAHVVNRNVNIGSQVNVGDNLGRLVGSDEFWVMLNVPVSTVNWLELPTDTQPGIAVKLRNASWPKDQFREGSLYKLVGTVTNQLRFAQVIVKVDNVMKREDKEPMLVIGTFVEATMPAKQLKDVVRVSSDYLRKGNTLWVMEDEKLQIRKIVIAFEDDQYVYVSNGLSSTDQVITTNLATVVEGAALRTAENNASAKEEKNG